MTTSKKSSTMTPSISATSTIASSSASSSAGTSGGESIGGNAGFQVLVTHDNLTFDARQAARFKEIEKHVDEEMRKRRSEWKRDVARMREEIIQLHPVATTSVADDTAGTGMTVNDGSGGTDDAGNGEEGQPTLEPFVARRRGSTDVLDARKMKTLYLEYPDAGRRCKLRFDVAGMDPDRLEVTTDGDRIIVRGTRIVEPSPEGEDDGGDASGEGVDGEEAAAAAGEVIDEEHREEDTGSNKSNTTSSSSNGVEASSTKQKNKTKAAGLEREYVRKIEKPKGVDHTKLRSLLTTDGILIVEAPLPPASLNLRSRTGSGSPRSNTAAGGVPKSHSGQLNNGAAGGAGMPTSASSSSSSLQKHAKSPPRAGGGGGAGGGSVAVSPGGASVNSASAGTAPAGSQQLSAVGAGTLQFARELHGIPTFREGADGRRRMFLVVDVGTMFGAKEVTVQIIKDSRIQVKGRHEERTSERLSRSKYSKDYELHERIESYSLRGGLTHDGRLMIGALVKGNSQRLSKAAAGELMADELAAMASYEPCNVLDLSTFPPTAPALVTGTSSMTTSMTSSSSSG